MAPGKFLQVTKPPCAPPASKLPSPSALSSSMPDRLLVFPRDSSGLQDRGSADLAGAFGISEDEAGPLIAADSLGKAEVADENGSLVPNQAGV